MAGTVTSRRYSDALNVYNTYLGIRMRNLCYYNNTCESRVLSYWLFIFIAATHITLKYNIISILIRSFEE